MTIISIPSETRGRPKNPMFDEVVRALKTLREGEAYAVEVPIGRNPRKFRAGLVVCLGLRGNSVQTSINGRTVAVWRKISKNKKRENGKQRKP